MKKRVLSGILILLCAACSSIKPVTHNKTLYQYYAPVTDAESLAFLNKGIARLTELYGAPRVPLKQVFLRHSVLRAKPYLLSAADILDWPAFMRLFRQSQLFMDIPAHKRLEFSKDPLSINQQTQIVNFLNTTIQTSDLQKSAAFRHLQIDKHHRRWITKFDKRHLSNRSLLCQKFNKLIMPFDYRRRLARSYQLCQMADKQRGRFVIYLVHPPGSEAFYNELGHEIFHLRDAEIYDWHVEGLASVFSEQLCRQLEKKWDYWSRKFHGEWKKKAYGISYFAMKEVRKMTDLSSFMSYRTGASKGPNYYALDINKWLLTLAPKKLKRVKMALLTFHNNMFLLNKGKNSLKALH